MEFVFTFEKILLFNLKIAPQKIFQISVMIMKIIVIFVTIMKKKLSRKFEKVGRQQQGTAL